MMRKAPLWRGSLTGLLREASQRDVLVSEDKVVGV